MKQAWQTKAEREGMDSHQLMFGTEEEAWNNARKLGRGLLGRNLEITVSIRRCVPVSADEFEAVGEWRTKPLQEACGEIIVVAIR